MTTWARGAIAAVARMLPAQESGANGRVSAGRRRPNGRLDHEQEGADEEDVRRRSRKHRSSFKQ